MLPEKGLKKSPSLNGIDVRGFESVEQGSTFSPSALHRPVDKNPGVTPLFNLYSFVMWGAKGVCFLVLWSENSYNVLAVEIWNRI